MPRWALMLLLAVGLVIAGRLVFGERVEYQAPAIDHLQTLEPGAPEIAAAEDEGRD